MEKLEVGQRVQFDLTETVVQACWAQGKHFTITFEDGRKILGDHIDPLIMAGRLKLLDTVTKPSFFEASEDNWDSEFGEDRED